VRALQHDSKILRLLALATDLGAERLATGHYVRRIDGADGAELHRAADPARDQSWFLFATRVRSSNMRGFRWGKCRTRCGARAGDAGSACRSPQPDSQDICFVPAGHYAEMVAALRPDVLAPGDIATQDGRVVGRHDGIFRYTVGQAKRLGPAASEAGERRVVVALNAAERRVVVGAPDSGSRTVRLREVNWLAEPARRRCHVKLRAREAPQPAETGSDPRWRRGFARCAGAGGAGAGLRVSTTARGCWAAVSSAAVDAYVDGARRAALSGRLSGGARRGCVAA